MAGRLGVLGGAFDPPHVGHAIVAQDVAEALELERLLIVPSARPPHRETAFPAELRYRLVRDLFAGIPGLEVSDVEMRRPGPSYTVDTLAQIREERAPEELYCVIGSDQLRAIHSWYRYERLSELARVAVMMRAGQERPSQASGRSIPYIAVDVTRVDVSSTLVRERLRAGKPIRFLVPETIRPEVERAWAERSGA